MKEIMKSLLGTVLVIAAFTLCVWTFNHIDPWIGFLLGIASVLGAIFLVEKMFFPKP
jgi:hypothetical protein